MAHPVSPYRDRQPGPYRAGVTGSRDWFRPHVIREALAAVLAEHPDAVLISGHASRGADMLAERSWAKPQSSSPAA